MLKVGKTHLTQCHTCDIIYIMTQTIKDKTWLKRADNIKPDSRGRVNLPKALVREGVMYHIYSNSMGQIRFDPQVSIPESEVWLFQNTKALESIKCGFIDAAEGRVSKINFDEL